MLKICDIKRLRHMSRSNINEMVKKKLIEGVGLEWKPHEIFLDACFVGNQTRKTHKEHLKKAKEIGNVIHFYLAVPFPVSVGGASLCTPSSMRNFGLPTFYIKEEKRRGGKVSPISGCFCK